MLVNKKTETVYGILPSAENLSPVLSAVPAARRAAVSEQLRSGRPFLLKDVSLSETLGVTAFSVPVRSGERQLAPHLVGYTDSDGKGVTGIEKSCDGFLSAASVKQTITYTLDGLGHSIPGIEPEIRSETGNGAGIVLSIDSIIQKVIENAGSAGLKKGAIVVMVLIPGRSGGCQLPFLHSLHPDPVPEGQRKHPYDKSGVFKLQRRLHL